MAKGRTKRQQLKAYSEFEKAVCEVISDAAARAAVRWLFDNPQSKAPIRPISGITLSLTTVRKRARTERMKVLNRGKTVFEMFATARMARLHYTLVRCELGPWITKLIEYGEGMPGGETSRACPKKPQVNSRSKTGGKQ